MISLELLTLLELIKNKHRLTNTLIKYPHLSAPVCRLLIFKRLLNKIHYPKTATYTFLYYPYPRCTYLQLNLPPIKLKERNSCKKVKRKKYYNK